MAKKKQINELIVEVDDNGTINKTTKKLNKLNEAQGNTTNAANKNKRAQEGVYKQSLANSKGFAKQAQGLGGLVSVYATVAANVFALSAAYQVLRQNSNFEIMIQASKDLSKTTGQNYAAVARDLKNITQGALDMESALQAASLGLSGGASSSQLAEIATIATKAAQVLGRNVPEAVTRMTQAVIKSEPELVDEFGIILRVTSATEKYAAAHGLAVKDLTAFQKSQALVNQLIEQGNDKFANAELRSNPYDKLSAEISDTGKTILSFVSGPLSAIADFFSSNSALILALIAGVAGKIASLAIPAFSAFGDAARASSAKAAIAYRENIGSMRKELAVLNNDLAKDPLGRAISKAGRKVRSNLVINNDQLNPRSNLGKSNGLDGEAFLAKNAQSIRAKLSDKAIKQAIEDGKEFIQIQKGVKIATADAAATVKLLNIELTKKGQAAVVAGAKTQGAMLKAGSAIQIAKIKTKELAITMNDVKATFSEGFANVQSGGFGKIAEEANKVGKAINGGSGFMAKFAQGASFAAFGIGKIGTAVSGMLGPLSMIVFAITTVYQILKSIAVATGFISEDQIKFSKKMQEINTLYGEQKEITEDIAKQNKKTSVNLTEQIAKNKANASAISGTVDLTKKIADNLLLADSASRGFGAWVKSIAFFINTPLDDAIEKLKETDLLLESLATTAIKENVIPSGQSTGLQDRINNLKVLRQEQLDISKDWTYSTSQQKEALVRAASIQNDITKIYRDSAQNVASIYTETFDAASALNKLTSKQATDILNSSAATKSLNQVDKLLANAKKAVELKEEGADLASSLDSLTLASIGVKPSSLSNRENLITDEEKTAALRADNNIILAGLRSRQKILVQIQDVEVTNAIALKGYTQELENAKARLAEGDQSAVATIYEREKSILGLKIDQLRSSKLQSEALERSLEAGSLQRDAQAAVTKNLKDQADAEQEKLDRMTDQNKELKIAENLRKVEAGILADAQKATVSDIALQSKLSGSSIRSNIQNNQAAGARILLEALSSNQALDQLKLQRQDKIDAKAKIAGEGEEFDLRREALQKSIDSLNTQIVNNTEINKEQNALSKDALIAATARNTNLGENNSVAIGIARFKQLARESDKETTKSLENFIQAFNSGIDTFSDKLVDSLIDGGSSFKDIFKAAAETFRSTLRDSLKASMSNSIKGLIANILPGLSDPLILSNGALVMALDRNTAAQLGQTYQGAAGASGILGGIVSGIGGLFGGSTGAESLASTEGFTQLGEFSSLTGSLGSGAAANSDGLLSSIGDFFSGFNFFAKGGITNGVSIAGEKGPEAVVPLPDGRTIPVVMSNKNSASNNNFNISINVDGGAATLSNQGSDLEKEKQGNDLAILLRDKVRDEISKQTRPGGLLYSNKQGNRR